MDYSELLVKIFRGLALAVLLIAAVSTAGCIATEVTYQQSRSSNNKVTIYRHATYDEITDKKPLPPYSRWELLFPPGKEIYNAESVQNEEVRQQLVNRGFIPPGSRDITVEIQEAPAADDDKDD